MVYNSHILRKRIIMNISVKRKLQWLFFLSLTLTFVALLISSDSISQHLMLLRRLNVSNEPVIIDESSIDNADIKDKPIDSADNSNVEAISREQQQDQSKTKVCMVPRLDPWDPSIAHMISHPKGFYCSHVQPYMSKVDFKGRLSLNETEIDVLKKSGKNFTCRYRTFDRKPGLDDDAVEYDAAIELHPGMIVQLKKDSVEVTCSYAKFKQVDKAADVDDDDNYRFYFNVHAQPVQTPDRLFGEPTEKELSVLVFLIDSVSHSAFVRNLPLTYAYTRDVMGIDFLKALNKVGDNSFPNQMAMFMGKLTQDEQEDLRKEVHVDKNTYFDSFPLIWKMFAAKGYATVFNEDMPHYALFNHMTKGWAKKPFDYYYHHFWQIVTKHYIDGQSARCFGNLHRAWITIDVAKRQVISLKDKLQFIYSILSELPHDADNRIEEADADLLDFWKTLYENNYLNRTFVIFASDHGIRHGNIRRTVIGSLEERLPFYGLYFPPWFHKKYPHIKQNLKFNEEILSSSFDVFETLLDVLNANFNGSQRHWSSRGQSHLYPLPLNRTCHMAGIADHFCTCIKKSKNLDTNSTEAHEAGRFLIAHLNSLLKNATNQCQEIKLVRVLYATEMDFDEKVKSNVVNYDEAKQFLKGSFDNHQYDESKSSVKEKKLEISVETEPNKASFEALLKCKPNDNGKFVCTVEGGISRTSQYAGFSDCVLDKVLRKFCSCIKK